MMKKYGLIGEKLSHSYSKDYFDKKFQLEGVKDCSYELFELQSIKDLNSLVKKDEELCGLNVTIPFKKEILPFLYEIDKEASQIWAINTVKISYVRGRPLLKGYNTDAFGFRKALLPYLQFPVEKALILGTGGAASAAKYVLQSLGIEVNQVSRSQRFDYLSYEELNSSIIRDHKLVVNCSPVGMYPKVDESPKLPYSQINSNHILFDMVYNPKETSFLKKGKEQGAICISGLEMLYHQADKAWEIWNS